MSAQSFKTLISFDETNGRYPFNQPVQGTDGNFYGTTVYGGASDLGTLYKINSAGKLTTLYSFCAKGGCADGGGPYGGLTLGTDGNFYGTTNSGGAHESTGTVFRFTPAGKLTTLYSFCAQTGCTDGYYPMSALVQGADGNFYGTTTGTTFVGEGNINGTVFKMTPAGKLTTLYTFCSQSACTDGYYPGGLVQGVDGNFYGTTYYGGSAGYGTVFKISSVGAFTTLYNFCSQPECTDGTRPDAVLIQAANGSFYGTTDFGGSINDGGTIFAITPAGKLTTVYTFCLVAGCLDGNWPLAGLVQAPNGTFYGSTSRGGSGGDGTLFSITAGGQMSTLYSFCSQASCADGETPVGGLLQATSGAFYGTTSSGGANTDGAVFSLSAGLGPFVALKPVSGKIGAGVIVLGNNFTGATAVTFNGVSAAFTVISSTEIKTTVPAGASSGKVKVSTPARTLSSNVNFRVLP